MEFRPRVDDSVKAAVNVRVLKVDRALTAQGCEGNVELKNKLEFIINEMGKLSAVAQEMRDPITSSDKLKNSDHVLYLMTEYYTPESFSVVGFLKMGWKKLYVYNKDGFQLPESMVYCLLDFYIYESKQRSGYGKHLMEYMLQDIGMEAKHLAIDKPTRKLLQFMWKHYQLSRLVNQGNNFVIFEEFFISACDEKNHDNSGNRATSYICQPTFGRFGAHKHHDTMSGIVQHNVQANTVKHETVHGADLRNSQFKEVNPHTGYTDTSQTDATQDLKFHHSALW